MDVDLINKESKDRIFYNQLQVLEHVILFILKDIGKIKLCAEEDNRTAFEIETNNTKIDVMFNFLSGALVLGTNESNLTLYTTNYIYPIIGKFYNTKAKKFSKLLYKKSLSNLSSCVKRLFIKTPPTPFSNIPLGLFIEILTLLDNKSLLNIKCINRELNQLLSSQETWKFIYCVRHGFINSSLSIDWRSVYLKPPPNNPLKLIST